MAEAHPLEAEALAAYMDIGAFLSLVDVTGFSVTWWVAFDQGDDGVWVLRDYLADDMQAAGLFESPHVTYIDAAVSPENVLQSLNRHAS